MERGHEIWNVECEEFVQVRVTKKGLEEVGWEAMDWINLAQNNEGWRALMNAIINLRAP